MCQGEGGLSIIMVGHLGLKLNKIIIFGSLLVSSISQ